MTLHLICSPQFWQLAAIVGTLVVALGWFRSGASPFVWMIRAGVHLEAARQQAIDSALVMVRHFAASYSPRVAAVRREFLEGA